MFSCTAFSADEYSVSESVKWNGPAPHPAKRLAYLENKIVPECQAVYIYYTPKGSVVHSPDASVITNAFCIDKNTVGKGIHTADVCEVMTVNWDKGIYTAFYGPSHRLFALGACSKKNLKKLTSEIKRQSKAMAMIDSKFAIMSDKIGFKQIIDSKK